MALDKLVDSSQLDTNLASVANAIRAKSGGSGTLVFPAGFVSEIGNIPTSGADMSALEVYIADFLEEPPIVTEGALNAFHRTIVS